MRAGKLDRLITLQSVIQQIDSVYGEPTESFQELDGLGAANASQGSRTLGSISDLG